MRKPELTVLVNTGQLGLQNSKLDSYKINVLAMNIIIFKKNYQLYRKKCPTRQTG